MKRRRTIKPRAVLFLVALLVAVGGAVHDKHTQGRTAGPEPAAIQTEGAVHNEYETGSKGRPAAGNGTGTNDAGQGRLEAVSSGQAGRQPAAYQVELSEHGNYAGVEAQNSDTLPAIRLSSRGIDSLDNAQRSGASLFDTIGQEYQITAYTAGPESCGKQPGDPDYGITYSGASVQENHTIAADLSILPLGTKVLIEGLDSVYTVEDKGSAVKGRHIDLYIPGLDDALDWGVQYRRIIILELGVQDNVETW